jgi:hypothetical protein
MARMMGVLHVPVQVSVVEPPPVAKATESVTADFSLMVLQFSIRIERKLACEQRSMFQTKFAEVLHVFLGRMLSQAPLARKAFFTDWTVPRPHQHHFLVMFMAMHEGKSSVSVYIHSRTSRIAPYFERGKALKCAVEWSDDHQLFALLAHGALPVPKLVSKPQGANGACGMITVGDSVEGERVRTHHAVCVLSYGLVLGLLTCSDCCSWSLWVVA